MKAIREILVCCLLVCSSAVCVRVCFLLVTAENAVKAIPAQVDARISAIQADLNNQITTGFALTDQQLTALRRDTNRQAELIRGTLDTRVALIQRDLIGQVATLNGTVSGLATGVNDTLKPIRETAAQVNDAAPDFLDCNADGFGNANCLYNRYVGTSKAIEQAAQQVAKSAPAMAAQAERIAVSGSGVADSVDRTAKEVAIAAHRLNAPQTKMQAVRSWLMTLARIYGAI